MQMMAVERIVTDGWARRGGIVWHAFAIKA